MHVDGSLWLLLRRSRLAGCMWALLLVAGVSGVIAGVRLHAPVADLAALYVVAVLAAAVTAGRVPAVVAAVASFLAFDLLFTRPYFALSVASPGEWVTLTFLLITGLVTGQLAALIEERTVTARENERNATVQYRIGRLVGNANVADALGTVAGLLRDTMDAAGVSITLPSGLEAHAGVPAATTYLAHAGSFGRGRVLGSDVAEVERFRPRRWIRLRVSVGVRAEDAYDLYRVRISAPQTQPHGEQAEGWLTVALPRGSAALSSADQRLLLATAGELAEAVERERLRSEATEIEVLRRTDELKTALLNTVSHDLRTPLAAIVGSAESLLQEDVHWGDTERREFLESIADEGRRLDRMVRHLLDLSRIEAGGVQIQAEWHDPGTVLTDAAERARSLHPARTVRVDVPSGLPPVRLDAIAIGEVITNLIENAFRHTPDDTTVTVAASTRADVIEFRVEDDGPGIPDDVAEHLFDPFHRTRSLRDQRGTGLGLAVAHLLVNAHGGTLTAHNRTEGGACFAFTIPLTPAHEPTNAADRTGATAEARS